MIIQLKCYLLCRLNGPEKKVRRIVFFFHFLTKFKMAGESQVTLNCFTGLFEGSNLPWPYVD